jgi:hypothetical protein
MGFCKYYLRFLLKKKAVWNPYIGGNMLTYIMELMKPYIISDVRLKGLVRMHDEARHRLPQLNS